MLVDASSSSGNRGNVTSYTFNHTCSGDTDLLVVCTRVIESTELDAPVAGITYNGDPLAHAVSQWEGFGNSGQEIWFLVGPDTGASYVVEVTHDGKCSDASASATSVEGAAAVPLDDVGDLQQQASGSPDTFTLTIDPAASGSIMFGCAMLDNANPANITVAVGTTQIDEVDEGAQISSSAYNEESGGAASVEWVITADGDWLNAVGATFKEDAGVTRIPRPPTAYYGGPTIF